MFSKNKNKETNTYSLEINHSLFSVILFQSYCLFEAENQVKGVELNKFTQTEKSDGRRIQICINTAVENFQEADKTFRHEIARANDFRLITLADVAKIIEKYDSFLKAHNLTSECMHKLSNAGSNYRPHGNAF